MTTHRQVARPRVYVWPRGKVATGRTEWLPEADFMDLTNLVVSMRVTKSLHKPVGTWEVTLVPDPGNVGPAIIRRLEKVYSAVQLGSIVSLGFEEDGGLMLGIVASRQRTRQRGGEQTSYSITFSGPDMARLLTQDSIVHASLAVPTLGPFLAKLSSVLGPTHPLLTAFAGVWGPLARDTTPTFLGASVKDAVDFALQNAPSMRLPLFAKSIGGQGFPGDFISTANSITTWNDARIFSDAPQDYQGSIWGFLQDLLDEDFYELWLDTTPTGFPLPEVELIIRPKPFDEPELRFAKTDERTDIGWKELKTRLDGLEHHEIAEDEVLMERLGTSDANTYSYYMLTTQNELIGNAQASSEGLSYPLVDTYNLTRFGLRDYSTRSSLVSSDISQKVAGNTDFTGETVLEVRELRNRLFNWYRLNSFFEEGELQVVGRDRYRVGDPVFLPWLVSDIGQDVIWGQPQGVRFYCTDITWEWTFGGTYTSNLKLSRGHNDAMLKAAKQIILLDAPLTNLEHFAES